MSEPNRATKPWYRRIYPRHSVRVRITAVAAVVTAAAVGTAAWLLVRSVEDTQLSQVRDDVDANLDQMATRLQAGDDPQDVVDAIEGRIEVTDDDGEVLASSMAPTGTTRDTDDDERDAADAASTPSGRGIAADLEIITRTVQTPSGDMTVKASVPVDQVARSVAAVRRGLVVGLPVLVALVAALAWVLVRRALRPVDALRAEVDEITGSTTHRRVPEPPNDDEIGRLARTMNAMLTRLDTSATHQRQFISDASHELRSPVTAIRAALEVARSKGDRADWTAVADTALRHESRLESLLDDLLLLAAHDENSTTTRPPTPVDLGRLATAEAEHPRRVPVHVTHHPSPTTGPERFEVLGDADQLARVLTNLLDNAARYAATAVHVTVTRRDGDREVRLTVDDDGPGIPPGDRERIFERFTRLDDSRARHNGGTGLGLAVVRSIVTHHHGHVRVDDSPTGGARFAVELPLHHEGPEAVPPPGS